MHFGSILQKQREFFDSGATNSIEFRKEQLKKLRDLVTTNREKFAHAIHDDLRRPEVQCLLEVDGIVAEIDFFLQNLDEWVQPEKKSTEPYGTTFIYKIPLGVVLVVSPFNFPIGLAIRPITAALAAGNTVVLKPSELSENSSTALAEAFASTFPVESVIVVEGDAKVCQGLLEQRYDHIFYTGSPTIGRLVMAAAAAHLTPVTLELGGKCPCVILDDTPDLAKVVQSLVQGKWINCGQVCLAVDYVLVTPGIKSKFLELLLDTIEKTFGEKPKESPHYARLINTNHFNRIAKLLKKTNGKILYGDSTANDHDDKFVGPHVVEVEAADPLMEDEVFGPVLSIVDVATLDEAIKFINEREKPLASYLFTIDDSKIERFFREVHSGGAVAGGIMLNYFSLQIPFGGVGESGMGRYHGKFGFSTFTHEKSAVRASL